MHVLFDGVSAFYCGCLTLVSVSYPLYTIVVIISLSLERIYVTFSWSDREIRGYLHLRSGYLHCDNALYWCLFSPESV